MLGQGVARSTAIAAIAAGVSILVAVAQADVQSTQTTKIPPGAKWSQAYIKEKDGTMLHADIERPAQLPASARTPVILSIGPYFNHSGQVGPAAPVEGVPFDPTAAKGPSTGSPASSCSPGCWPGGRRPRAARCRRSR